MAAERNDEDRKLIAVSDQLLIDPLFRLTDKLCYFKSTGTSNERFQGKFKNTWLPCLGFIETNSGGHLVKSGVFNPISRIPIGRLIPILRCYVSWGKDKECKTFIKSSQQKIVDDMDVLLSYVCSWRQLQISALLSEHLGEQDDYWSKHNDIKNLVLKLSISDRSTGYKVTEECKPIDNHKAITLSNKDFFTQHAEYDYFRNIPDDFQNDYMRSVAPGCNLTTISRDPSKPVSAVSAKCKTQDPEPAAPSADEVAAYEQVSCTETRAAAEPETRAAVEPESNPNPPRRSTRNKLHGKETTTNIVRPVPYGGRRTRRSIRTRRSKRSRRSKRR